jgi:hypothetical protein
LCTPFEKLGRVGAFLQPKKTNPGRPGAIASSRRPFRPVLTEILVESPAVL